MECFLLNQNNTIDIFVKNRTDVLFHGRSVKGDFNNTRTAVLSDVFRQRRKGLGKRWRMATADIMLSFRHGCVGYLAVGDLERPDTCCCVGISQVQHEYIRKLHAANEDLMAVTALIDLRNGK